MIDDPYARKQKWKPRGKAPSGRPYCFSGCGREVPAPRRTSCSDACAQAWNERNNPRVIARVIFERDRGICQHCRLDTEALRRSCRAVCPIEAPDEFQIADLMGYRTPYCEPRPPERFWSSEIRPDVAAAVAVAQEMHWREIVLPWQAFAEEQKRECAARGFTDPTRRWWEADHIVPVIEGGGGCGPEGYRTLCLSCHRKETAKLAARRAESRRKAKATDITALPLFLSK